MKLRHTADCIGVSNATSLFMINNSYVLGGVEELYERILKRNDATSYQEYIMNFYDFVEDIAGRLYNKEIDD